MSEVLPAGSVAEQLLRLLAMRGVELFASNSGTDFTPIIEALAALGSGEDSPRLPRVVLCPHENTAIALAHGHALLSGRPQVVMGHVGVGSANMGMGIINARRARVPIVVLAGLTPWYEQGVPGVRSNFVQWGQDCFDQRAMFREYTKWDYELRSEHALDTVVDRALAIAASDPAGPVYLTLPKEPLCRTAGPRPIGAVPRQRPVSLGTADPRALEDALARLREAERPLVVTADLGRHAGGPEALQAFSEAWGAGVVEFGKRNFYNFPTSHAHHLGFDPHPLVADADLVLAVACPVPWIPTFGALKGPPPPVIAIGIDPLFADLPMRGFPCDLGLLGDPAAILQALADPGPRRAARALAVRHAQIFTEARARAEAEAAAGRLTKRVLSYTLGRVLEPDDVVFNEYPLDPTLVPREQPGSWFENSIASGLGWALGASLGAKLAAPARTIVTTVGDGSYLFNTPVSAHYVAAAEGLPTLTVIFDDRGWSTIRRSTRGSHPDGAAVRSGAFALCDFPHALDYAAIARACGLVGMAVHEPADLEPILRDAIGRVRGGESVVVAVRCEKDG